MSVTKKYYHQFQQLSATSKRIALIALVAVFVGGSLIAPHFASADRFESQISELQNQNSQVQSQVAALKEQASSYSEAINLLRQQIGAVEAQISQNQERQAELQREINKAQVELDHQKKVLGENIKSMYVGSEMSTIEMLATSKSLSEFVDKETYRNAVQRQVQETMVKIQKLQNELNGKKQEVDTLLKEQQVQRATLDESRSEQNRLLSMNQGQQAEFSGQLKANNARIAELRQQQAEENCRLYGCGGGTIGGGGYPWGTAVCIHTGKVDGRCSNYDWSVNGQIYNWTTGGYGYRNCTDWVSFRVKQATGRYAPAGLGNANTWDDRGPGYGFAVSSTPRQGAAAVSNSGYYGHVMYVEAVYDDGSILVSDYNRAGTGLYATTKLSASSAASLRYVYF